MTLWRRYPNSVVPQPPRDYHVQSKIVSREAVFADILKWSRIRPILVLNSEAVHCLLHQDMPPEHLYFSYLRHPLSTTAGSV